MLSTRLNSENEIRAYIGGLLDGEGSIFMGKDGEGKACRLYISIALVVRAPLDLLLHIYGGRLSQERIDMVAQSRIFHWRLCKKQDVERFLRDIRPFLIIKVPQVDLALDFLMRFSKKRGLPYTPVQREEMHIYRRVLRMLNSKGPAALEKKAAAEGLLRVV